MKHCIVYMSPHGSTWHVAEVMARKLSELGEFVEILDLGRKGTQPEVDYRRIPAPKCLWVGSPVYVNHAVPVVERFLQSLEKEDGCYAVPFVTWGGVNSGVALSEMAGILSQKGYALLGGAKVLAVHSMLWEAKDPLGAGHPDPEDDAMVESLVDTVHRKLMSKDTVGLPPEALDYQPESVKEESRVKSITVAKKHLPIKELDEEKCTQCGQCAARCPAGAIGLDPYPIFGEECILCLRCVRECPEGAILLDMSGTEERLRGMAKLVGEKPPTGIFV